MAYNRLARPERGNDAVTLAGCWAHVRRKFYELHVSSSSEVATATIERMTQLWQVEETVRGKEPEARAHARQAMSATIVADLFNLWQDTLPRISGKSKLAEIIRYAIQRRAIRPQTITRNYAKSRIMRRYFGFSVNSFDFTAIAKTA
jgi:hypothetical protein